MFYDLQSVPVIGTLIGPLYIISENDICYVLLTAIGLTAGGNSTVQYSTVQYTFTHKRYREQHN